MKIFNEIEKYIKLSDRDRIVLIQHLKLKKIKKGELLCLQGQSNDFIGFVENGLLRSYASDKNGKVYKSNNLALRSIYSYSF